MIDVRHIHPRHKRPVAASPYRPLHAPLKPVPAGMSRAKPAIEYRHGSRAAVLKLQRKAMGWTRSEHDRIRWLAARA